MARVYKADNGYSYKAVSRWLPIKSITVTSRHRLADYAYNGSVDIITFRGKQYALAQFMRVGYPIMYYDEDGKLGVISGIDSTEYYKPLWIEIHHDCESVRLYEELPKEDE